MCYEVVHNTRNHSETQPRTCYILRVRSNANLRSNEGDVGVQVSVRIYFGFDLEWGLLMSVGVLDTTAVKHKLKTHSPSNAFSDWSTLDPRPLTLLPSPKES